MLGHFVNLAFCQRDYICNVDLFSVPGTLILSGHEQCFHSKSFAHPDAASSTTQASIFGARLEVQTTIFKIIWTDKTLY